MIDILTQDILKTLLEYDPNTGIFIWIKKTSAHSTRSKIGGVAGCKDSEGYLIIRIDGKGYKAHRLAWLYMAGEWPPEQIDHINLIRDDNRWCNLRLATQTQNQWNMSRNRKNTTGFKGVCKAGDKYQAQIKNNRKLIWLGYYDTPEEAHEAYKKAAIRTRGKYARFE